METRYAIKGTRNRIEARIPQGDARPGLLETSVTIMDLSSGTTTMLFPQTKTYMTMNWAEMAEDMNKGDEKDSPIDFPKVTSTGKTETIAGYTCDDACQPEGDLRIYDTRGDLAWQTSLSSFPTKQLGTRDLRWSPAGYAVVATGGMKGNETAFTVRAFAPSKIDPVWTFARKDGQMLHVALALAIGHYGEVYAGGLGANGFPAVAYIGG